MIGLLLKYQEHHTPLSSHLMFVYQVAGVGKLSQLLKLSNISYFSVAHWHQQSHKHTFPFSFRTTFENYPFDLMSAWWFLPIRKAVCRSTINTVLSERKTFCISHWVVRSLLISELATGLPGTNLQISFKNIWILCQS